MVVPTDIACTEPVTETVAMPGDVLDHVPATDVSVNVTVAPTHKGDVPEIGPAKGVGLTVTVCVAVAEPQLAEITV